MKVVERLPESVRARVRLACGSRDIPWSVRAFYHEPRDEVNARSRLGRSLQALAQLREVWRLPFLPIENAEGAVEVAAGAIPEGIDRRQLVDGGQHRGLRRRAPRQHGEQEAQRRFLQSPP